MKNIKAILPRIPEYYLIVLVLLAGFTPPFSISPVSVVCAIALVLQIMYKNRKTGLIIAGLFMVVNLGAAMALIAELGEFSVYPMEFWALLLGGLALMILNFTVVGIMIYRYAYFLHRYPADSIPVF
jgi:inner membrane protein involved in colicin E2 resistance